MFNSSINLVDFYNKLGYVKYSMNKNTFKSIKERIKTLGLDENKIKNGRKSFLVFKKCNNCNKEYKGNKNQKFCSQKCAIQYREKNKINLWLKTGNAGCDVSTTIRSCIRRYILKEQNNKCSICGIENKWNNKELKFILDHINGDASNNNRENLRLICPNCDSQLETYKSKNKNSARKFRRQ